MKIRNGFVSNSSSEVFICKTDKSIEEIEVILQKMIYFWNEINNTDFLYSDIFDSVRLGDGTDYRAFKWYYEYLNLEDVVRKPIIESADDNTIPYALYNFIEDVFNADRIHLG